MTLPAALRPRHHSQAQSARAATMPNASSSEVSKKTTTNSASASAAPTAR
jgi:hypothetical protein